MTIQQRNEKFWDARNFELARLSDEIISLMEFYDIYDIELDVLFNLVKESYGNFTEIIQEDDDDELEDLE